MSSEKKNKFSSSSLPDWTSAAAKEMNGSEPFSTLSKKVNGVSVKPYYDVKDVPQHDTQKSNFEFASWLNIPKISVDDARRANEAALAHLNSGADGILFDLKTNVQPEHLLRSIELQYCHIFFCLDKSAHIFRDLFHAFIDEKKVKPNGGFYFNGDDFEIGVRNFRYGLKVEPNENCADQISSAFIVAASRMDRLMSLGMSPADSALRSISFLWPVRQNFFISISEMSAMRMVWNLFSEAYGAPDVPLFLHAISPGFVSDNFQPHGNLIKQTTCGLAAVLGNCSALTCEAEKEDSLMLTRTARNISSILKEESHLDKVIDPLAGTYFVEQSSVELAEVAWKKIQQIV